MSAGLPSAVLAAGAGLALGFLGGLGHLLVTRWRASLLPTRGAGVVLLLLPFAIALPVGAVLLAASVAPAAAWASPVGLVLARVLLLRHLGGA